MTESTEDTSRQWKRCYRLFALQIVILLVSAAFMANIVFNTPSTNPLGEYIKIALSLTVVAIFNVIVALPLAIELAKYWRDVRPIGARKWQTRGMFGVAILVLGLPILLLGLRSGVIGL